MPYRWTSTDHGESLTLWAHNALTVGGFVGFIGITAALLALPLIGLIGTPLLWIMLPFLLATIAAIWVALRTNNRNRQLREELAIGPQAVSLTRIGPENFRQEWQANRYWVRPVLLAAGGPVAQYITLRGGPREVELGAFLTEDERLSLFPELAARLSKP